MKQSDFSAQFPVVWASGAGSETVQYPVPATTEETGRASLTLGFPPATMTPLGAGGAYPKGADVNGGFRMTSTSGQNYEAGIVPPWSSSFAQSIGGYPLNACVADPATGGVFWRSTADDNLTTPGATEASWVNFFAPVQQGRLLNVQVIVVSQAYSPTAGTTSVVCDMVAGGGGGGGSPAVNDRTKFAAATGGQAGSWLRFRIAANLISGLYVTIGGGGAGGDATGKNGGSGGDTSFGSFYRVYGGPGGQGGAILTAPGTGLLLASSQSPPAGNTIASTLGGGPGSWIAITGLVGVGSKGGDSHFGPGGYMGPGQSGASFGGAGGNGAGGAGAFTPGDYTLGLQGAAGGSGLVIIYEYS